MIHSLEIEQQLLAGLIKYPEQYGEIANFISEKDFVSSANAVTSTIYAALKTFCENGKGVDHVVLSEKIKSLGFCFAQDISISDYLYSLSLRKIDKNQITEIAKELKKYTVRREIYEAAKKTAETVKALDPNSSFNSIIEAADKTFNEKIDVFDLSEDNFSNIYGEEMQEYIEYLGNNPKEEMGFMGPFEPINNMYGSLLRPGNITVIVARSGVGKTRFCLDYCTKVAEKYNVPVLHFDNGEMSRNELMIRQCSSLSGVSTHLLETGQWRQAGDEIVNKVRSVWSKISNLKFYYHSVGGYSLEKMVNVLKRFYYSKIGRGNKMIFSFDYIKPVDDPSKAEWQSIGNMVDTFKRTIQREILVDGEPIIPMFTSIQSNRSGIVTNRQARDVNDDEGIVSGSDRVTQYCSHLFILREKTADEILQETERFGTHKLILTKSRHLGRQPARAQSLVQMPDRTVKNSIQLLMNGFQIDCVGDQQDVADFINAQVEVEPDEGEDIDLRAFESGDVPTTIS